MMRKIDRLNAVCIVLNNFVKEHQDALDEGGAKGLEALGGRIAGYVSRTISSSDEVAVARALRADTFDALQRALIECRKNIEIVAVRDGKNVVLPLTGRELPSPRRIIALTGDYLQAAATAGDDPALAKSAEVLRTALDAYLAARGARTNKVYVRRTFREGMDAELGGLAARVSGYTSLIAYNVSDAERRQLLMRIKSTLPRQKGKAAGEAGQPATGAEMQRTATVTTLQAVPTTTVPPSSEHPTMSANA